MKCIFYKFLVNAPFFLVNRQKTRKKNIFSLVFALQYIFTYSNINIVNFVFNDLNNIIKLSRFNRSIFIGYSNIRTEKVLILCETYRFTSLGAYLYFELFKCIEEKYMPIKCSNCGRWFIMKHTTFSHFCTRAVSSNPRKNLP